MEFTIKSLTPREQYKILSALITPRPIALVSTRDENGIDNVAPFSFFNLMSEDPPVVVLGLQTKADGNKKDTSRNIHHSGEFVVNLVDEAIIEEMNACAIAFPEDISEADETALTMLPCSTVSCGRVEQSPVHLECRLLDVFNYGGNREIVHGEIVTLHVRNDLIDADNMHIDAQKYAPVGRLFGSLYARTIERFILPIPSREEWRQKQRSAKTHETLAPEHQVGDSPDLGSLLVELEEIDLDTGWVTLPHYPPGMAIKPLTGNLDEKNKKGHRAHLVRMEPGVYTTEPFVHDFWEEICLLSGDLIDGNDADGNGGVQLNKFAYAYRPPGTVHGPFKTEGGCLILEIHSYKQA